MHFTNHPFFFCSACKCDHSDQFLLWHSAYIVDYEMGLASYLRNPELGLPYWDWTENDWNWLDFFRQNTWARGPRFDDDRRQMKVDARIERDIRDQHRFPRLDNRVRNTMCMTDFREFQSDLESIHNNVHEAIGGDMVTMGGASFDPIFWLHHNFVEKIFEEWQDCRRLSGDTRNSWFSRAPNRNRPLACYDNSDIVGRSSRLYDMNPSRFLNSKHKFCYEFDRVECSCGRSRSNTEILESEGFNRASIGPVTDFLGGRVYLAFINRIEDFIGTFRFRICQTDVREDYGRPCTKLIKSDESIRFFGDGLGSYRDEPLPFYYDITDYITDWMDEESESGGSNRNLQEYEQTYAELNFRIQLDSFSDSKGNDVRERLLDYIDLYPYTVYRPSSKPGFVKVTWGSPHLHVLRIRLGTTLIFIGNVHDSSLGEFQDHGAYANCHKDNADISYRTTIVPTLGYHIYYNPNRDCSPDQMLKVHVED